MKYLTYIVTNLDETILAQVGDIVVDPPETGRYEGIKSELIKGLANSDGIKMRKLLESEEVGDRMPLQSYRDLKEIAILMLSDQFILTLWKNRLQAEA